MGRFAHVIGFHGCDRSIGEALLRGDKAIEPSRNDYDWLGHGAYFWEGDLKRAKEWADWLAKRKDSKVEEPFVVGAVIDLGRCMDLADRNSLKILKAGYRVYRDFMESSGVALPQNDPVREGDNDLLWRHLDCAVINFTNSLIEGDFGDLDLEALGFDGHRRPYDTIRSPFAEGGPLFKGAKIMSKTHVQLCVRNLKMIKGFFKPMNWDL